MVQHNCHRCIWNTQKRNIFVEKMGKRRWRSIQGPLQWKPLRKQKFQHQPISSSICSVRSSLRYDAPLQIHQLPHFWEFTRSNATRASATRCFYSTSASSVTRVTLGSEYSVDAHRSSNSRKRLIISFDGEYPCCPFFKIWPDRVRISPNISVGKSV